MPIIANLYSTRDQGNKWKLPVDLQTAFFVYSAECGYSVWWGVKPQRWYLSLRPAQKSAHLAFKDEKKYKVKKIMFTHRLSQNLFSHVCKLLTLYFGEGLR